MPKPNQKTTEPSSKDKNNLESRLTESSSAKLLSRGSYGSSVLPSSSSSFANISLNLAKDNHFHKLFNHSPLLYSINSQPLTTKNSITGAYSLNTPCANGPRTLSLSSIRSSISSTYDRNPSKCYNHFYKKSKDLVIDLAEKQDTENKKEKKLMGSWKK
jgi:hypothetical protein